MNQEADAPYHLGVDLGTTFTAAAICSDGQIDVVDLGNRASSIPSVVFLGGDGTFVVGEGAERRAHVEPNRVAREFKRRLGDPTPVVLGGVPCSADLLTAELLKAVVAHVSSQRGAAPASIALTHPAAWGPYKLDLLRQAARIAECGHVELVSEPEAAVLHYGSTERVESGAAIAVYDFGGGTFDAAVVRQTEQGTEVLGRPEGIEGLGGVDFDQELLRLVYGQLGDQGLQLDQGDPLVQSALLRLRDECRDAKEGLSMVDSVTVPVMLPSIQQTIEITRGEFEATIAPSIEQTIDALRSAIASAGVEPAALQSVLLAGGSSRIPLVQQLVRDRIGRPVALDAHPKFIVAKGAAGAAAKLSGGAPQARQPEPPAPVIPVIAGREPTTPTSGDPDVTEPPGSVTSSPTASQAAVDPPVTSVYVEPVEPVTVQHDVPELTPASASVFQAGQGVPATEEIPASPGAPAASPTKPAFTPAAPEGERSIPWVLLVLGVLLFAGIVGGFLFLSGGGDDPPGEEARETDPAGTDNESVANDSSGSEAPTAVADPTEPAAPTEGPDATPTTAAFEPQVLQTVQVGEAPDTPLQAGGLLWVPNAGSDTLTRLEPVSGAREEIVVGARPDTPLEAAGAIWVPARDAGTLARVDLDDLAVSSIPVGTRADTPTLAADHLWVAVRGTNQLVVVDPADSSIVQTIALQGRPLTPIVVGDELWFVTRDDSALHVVDLAGFDPAEPVAFESVAVGTDPERPLAAEGRIWVPSREDATIDVVDPASRQVIGTVTVGDAPDTPVAAAGKLWVSNAEGETVTVVDAATLEVVAEILVGAGPRTGVVAAGSAWIPVNAGSTLVQLDLETTDQVGSFITGLEPDTPVVFDDSVWVPNAGSASVLQLQVQ